MYHYTLCGLDYIYLSNGYHRHETPYGSGVAFEKADGLDAEIAAAVIFYPARLRGQEVRFMRSLLHLSQKKLAEKLGVKRVTVARWEGKPHTAIPGASDRMLRVSFAFDKWGDDAARHVYDSLSEIDDTPAEDLTMTYGPVAQEDELPGILDHSQDGWTRAAA